MSQYPEVLVFDVVWISFVEILRSSIQWLTSQKLVSLYFQAMLCVYHSTRAKLRRGREQERMSDSLQCVVRRVI